MAQHDYDINSSDAISGLQFRQDVNNVLSAIKSSNSGATAPTTYIAGTLWLDTSTTPHILKKRNTANTGWDTIRIEDALGAPIASGATTTVGTYSGGNTVNITGTTTITSLGVSTTGTTRTLIFNGSLTLTHNATSLICPNGLSITTVSGDVITVICEDGALGYWRIVSSARILPNHFAGTINSATAKTTPVDADLIGLVDSADSFALKKLTWANIKTTLGLLFAPIASPAFTGDASINGVNIGVYPYRNRLINGAMNVSQINGDAAATVTAGAALQYVIDQWYAYCTGANVTGQRIAGSGQSKYLYQYTGAASVTKIAHAQRMEAINTYDLNGKSTIVGIDMSNSLLTSVTWTAWYANTTDTFGTLASPTRTLIGTGTITVSSTVERHFIPISIPSAATTGIEIEFSVGAQISGTWVIGNAQFEKVPTGTTQGTDYERLSYDEELRRCQRYYEKISYINGSEICLVSFYNTTTASSNAINFSNKRVFGTIIVSNIAHFEARSSASDALSLATIAGISSSLDSAYLGFSVSVATTAGTVGRLRAINSLAYIAISAQL